MQGVAQEFRGWGGDRHEYFSDSPDLALVKAVTAHTGRRAGRRGAVVALFGVRKERHFR